MTFRLRVMDVSQTTAKLIVATLSNATITATCSGGEVSVGATSERIESPFLGAALVTIIGLQAWTQYDYEVVQNGQSISGSFRTMPANQQTDFQFIVATCDNPFMRGQRKTFSTLRQVVEDSSLPPVVMMFHPDDLNYVDGYSIDDSAWTGLQTTGSAEDTGLAADYAIGWASYYGLLPSQGKWRYEDRQWVYRNLPCVASGGDHMIASNHCRGPDSEGGPAFCDRSIGGLEEIGKAEWDAFVGQGNPPALRTDQLHWGKEIGPILFALHDSQLYSEPYDFEDSDETNWAKPHYDSDQLADIRAYLNVDTHWCKIGLFETGWANGVGQPWYDRWRDEASAWKIQLEADDNLNGVEGNFTFVCGDNHNPHVVSYESFWTFCAGVLEDANSVGRLLRNQTFPHGGAYRWDWPNFVNTGDNLTGGFWLFRYYAAEETLEARFIKGGVNYARLGLQRSTMYGPVYLERGATNNQWTYTPNALTYPRTRVA